MLYLNLAEKEDRKQKANTNEEGVTSTKMQAKKQTFL